MYDWYHQAMASGVRHCQEFARTLFGARTRYLVLYKTPDIQWPSRRHEQQNQNHEPSALRLTRRRVLQAKAYINYMKQVLFRRMNRKVAGAGRVHTRIVNFIQHSLTKCEPNENSCRTGCAASNLLPEVQRGGLPGRPGPRVLNKVSRVDDSR